MTLTFSGITLTDSNAVILPNPRQLVEQRLLRARPAL
jgi:hypothetical protein